MTVLLVSFLGSEGLNLLEKVPKTGKFGWIEKIIALKNLLMRPRSGWYG